MNTMLKYDPNSPENKHIQLFVMDQLVKSKEKTRRNSYTLLKQMCKVKNSFPSSSPQISPLTNRVTFITEILNSFKVQYQLDVFSERGEDVLDYNNSKLINVIVEFNSHLRNIPATMFSAHHDVVNIHSDNAQDNTASICNLLYLCKILKQQELSNKRIIVVFTDREECGGIGAKRMSNRINSNEFGTVDKIYNLELTGLGKTLWVDTKNFTSTINHISLDHLKETLKGQEVLDVFTPFSDAVIFRKEGLDAVCIGILPKEDVVEKSTWTLCHSIGDDFNNTNEEDMTNFVENVLCELI